MRAALWRGPGRQELRVQQPHLHTREDLKSTNNHVSLEVGCPTLAPSDGIGALLIARLQRQETLRGRGSQACRDGCLTHRDCEL